MPIPADSRQYATLPWAINTLPLCEIRIDTFVPTANGVVVLTKQPNALKSFVCAATCASLSSAVTWTPAPNGNRRERGMAAPQSLLTVYSELRFSRAESADTDSHPVNSRRCGSFMAASKAASNRCHPGAGPERHGAAVLSCPCGSGSRSSSCGSSACQNPLASLPQIAGLSEEIQRSIAVENCRPTAKALPNGLQ